MAYICMKPAGSCPKCDHYRYDREEGQMACFAELDEQAVGKHKSSPTVGEWISVSDRLPKPKEHVLVSSASEGYVVEGYWWCGKWQRAGYGSLSVMHPTHWMPIPKPPLVD